MDRAVKDVVVECTRASAEERITFPEVLKALMGAGVERYHADLVRGERTYYMPDGDSECIKAHALNGEPAKEFSAAGVEAALRAIQRGEIQYREFCRRIADAGCVGYIVSVAGWRSLYYGRTADIFVEHFPARK